LITEPRLGAWSVGVMSASMRKSGSKPQTRLPD
jgi:hypothetical protein